MFRIVFLFSLLLFLKAPAQLLEIEHHDFLVDTIPFRFLPANTLKTYDKIREIRIGCLNTGKGDLTFSIVKLGLKSDTSFITTSTGVRFPGTLRQGQYGVIVITWGDALSSFDKIKIYSNSKNGTELIRIRDTYQNPLEVKRDGAGYSYKVREGEPADFNVWLANKGVAPITIDSMVMPDPTLQFLSNLPMIIQPGKSERVTLRGITKGKMNFYQGGSPAFFFHTVPHLEDFTKQEFSCVIIPNIVPLTNDTFNFKSVKRGTTVTAIYTFANKGTVALQTSKAATSCIKFDKETVGPGENFTITITYNTAVADSNLTIHEFQLLFAPFFYTYNVYVKGNITGPARTRNDFLLAEKKIDFGTIYVDSAKSLRREIRVQNKCGVPIRVTNISTGGNGSYGIYNPKNEIPPEEFFTVTFVYDTRKQGPFEKDITISYNTSDCSAGTFYYTIHVSGDVKPKTH